MNDRQAEHINADQRRRKTVFAGRQPFRQLSSTGSAAASELLANLEQIHRELGRLVQDQPLIVDGRGECGSQGVRR